MKKSQSYCFWEQGGQVEKYKGTAFYLSGKHSPGSTTQSFSSFNVGALHCKSLSWCHF